MNKRLARLLASGVAATVLSAAALATAPASAQVPYALMTPFAQATAAEAQSLLQEALARLERAKTDGGDVAAAEAEVAAAQAALDTLVQAETQAAEAAKQAEAQAAADAEAAAKAAADAEAAKQAEAQAAADAEAAAKAAADAEAAKQADAQAAADAEAAAKAAADAEAAKQAEAQAAADAEAAAKAAADAEAAKQAEAQAAADAEAAAKAEADAEAAKKAAEQPAEPAPVVEPTPAEPAPVVEPTPVEPAPAPTEPVPEAPAPAVEPTPAEPAPVVEPAPVDPVPAVEPTPAPVDPAPAVEPTPAPAEPVVPPTPDPVLETLPEPLPENAAPVLDSAKEVPVAPAGEVAPAPTEPTAPPLPAPVTDAESQVNIVPVEIKSAVIEDGIRLTELPRAVAPPEQEVVKVIDNSTIVTVNNVFYIDTPDSPRLTQKDDEVIIERLPRGRTRETIVRENGVQVVTIRNRYGDIIQRSRVLPDGREVFLSYSPEYDREDYVEFRDPGLDLPPLVLNVPIREYILSVSLIEEAPADYDDEVIYYDFLEKPPVERVERTYSVNEVKRSARVRDKVRRIDLDTITFGFGNADIKDDQIEKLESVANAMLKLLQKNPGETFLIEGHTDAVGTDVANLGLSDRRASAIAEALTNSFDIPSENLATQGYGERYLKVKTQKPSELNRRVSIRRITQLVAPVASK